jgi:hypothetical protein
MIKSESFLLRIQNIVVKQVLYPVDNCKWRYISTCGIATDIFTVHCRHPEPEFLNFYGAKESIPKNQFHQAV